MSKAKSTLPDESALGNDLQLVGKVVHTYLFIFFSLAGQSSRVEESALDVCCVLPFSSGSHSVNCPPDSAVLKRSY